MNQLKLTAILAAISVTIISVGACGAIKLEIHDANRIAARLLCEEAFAEKTGLPHDEVRQKYCATQEALDPFLKALEEARSEVAEGNEQ